MSNIINVARGLEKADLVIKNASVVNVLSEEIYKADIAVANGLIARNRCKRCICLSFVY